MRSAVIRRGEGRCLRDEPYATLWEKGGGRPSVQLGCAFFVVDPGTASPRHWHHRTEELYLIVRGRGVMELDAAQVEVTAGDCIWIEPETRHALSNPGPHPLEMWVITTPPYDEGDEVLVASDAAD